MSPLTALFHIILALPFYSVVVFCCYSLFTIGLGLATFPTADQAYLDLVQDMRQAHEQLTKQGYNVW